MALTQVSPDIRQKAASPSEPRWASGMWCFCAGPVSLACLASRALLTGMIGSVGVQLVGDMESLNVAVAGSILMYALGRR